MKDISCQGEKLVSYDDLPEWRGLSISDDDICATCKFCLYNPGKESYCDQGWPALFNVDGYARKCQKHWQIDYPEQNLVTLFL